MEGELRRRSGDETAFACYRFGDAYVGRCHSCGGLHSHGAASRGLRHRKCWSTLSPGRHQAIVLDVRGEVGSIDDIEPTPFAAVGRHLCPALETSAAALRKAILSAAIGGRWPYRALRRFGKARVCAFDCGSAWTIDGLGEKVEGRGALPLVAYLSGASMGALCIMILRLLGLDLAVEDLRQIQAFIDARLRFASGGAAK